MSFEHYLDTQRPNPRRAALLTFAAALSVSATAMMLVAGWAAGKLSIARVEPPTVDYVLLSLSIEEPLLPPPPPPPPPAGAEEPEEPEPEDVVPEDEGLEQPPDERPKEIPAKKPGGGKPRGIPGGQEGGQVGGMIGGIPNSPLIGIPSRPIATRPTPQAQPMRQPLSTVMSRAVYSPDPSAQKLQMTRAARFDKRDGKNVTSFCIDTNGRTVDVRTKVPFPGDPEVDKIIRQTIKSWRFKAFQLGSKKVKTCTERTFMLRFE